MDEPAISISAPAVVALPRRRVNPLGAFSIGAGLVTSALAVTLYGDALRGNEGVWGAVVYVGVAIVTSFAGCVGGLAGLFGLVRRPRWQGFVGVLLNVGVPAGLLFLANSK